MNQMFSESELTHSMVHYLFSIHKLKEQKGYARVTDIAKEMNLSKGSVSVALISLKKKELIIEDENKFFNLSEKGHNQVHSILTSRTLLYFFLKDFLKVSEDTSKRDACLIEHLLSEETREKFFEFMKKLSSVEEENIKNKLDIVSILDLSSFNSAKDFEHTQQAESFSLK